MAVASSQCFGQPSAKLGPQFRHHIIKPTSPASCGLG